ncbi:hypothetical protein ACFL2T_04090 [Elusimicrobiota bacterium]
MNSKPVILPSLIDRRSISATQGILWGFISHAGLYLAAGRRKELHPVMGGLALISIGLLTLEHLG